MRRRTTSCHYRHQFRFLCAEFGGKPPEIKLCRAFSHDVKTAATFRSHVETTVQIFALVGMKVGSGSLKSTGPKQRLSTQFLNFYVRAIRKFKINNEACTTKSER